jgi:hypothetical protein
MITTTAADGKPIFQWLWLAALTQAGRSRPGWPGAAR